MAKNVRNRIVRAALEIVGEHSAGPKFWGLTTRQLFYQMVSAGYIENTDKAYKSMADHLTKARLDGEFPPDAMSDPGRTLHHPHDRSGPARFVLTEKEAIMPVVLGTSREFGAFSACTQGIPSVTLLDDIVSEMATSAVDLGGGSTPEVYILTDLDKVGLSIRSLIPRHIKTLIKSRGYEHLVPEVKFETLFLTPMQAREIAVPRAPHHYELESLDPLAVYEMLCDALRPESPYFPPTEAA